MYSERQKNPPLVSPQHFDFAIFVHAYFKLPLFSHWPFNILKNKCGKNLKNVKKRVYKNLKKHLKRLIIIYNYALGDVTGTYNW